TVGRPFTRRTRFHSSPALFKIRKLFTRRMIQAWRWYGYGYWEHTETSHYLKTAPPHAVSDETAEVHTEDYPGLRGPGLFVDDGKRPSIQKVCEDPAKLRKTVTHSKIGGLVIKAQAPLVAWIYGHPDIASKDHSWYAGETIRKQIGVISEHPYPVEATVKWWVKQTNGKQIAEGETLASFERGDQQLHPIVFKSPIVTEKSRYVIEIETSVEGKVVHEDQFPFQVFPPHKTAGITGNIGLIDSQATGAMLRIAGVSYTPVTETSDLSKLDLLVIGRQCRQAEVRELLKKLDINKHLAAGLNVLVFEQNGQVLERPTPDPWPRLTLNDRPDRPELASFGLRIEHTSSRYTFIRNPEHPIFKGLSNEDIANWRGASNHLPPWTRLEWMGNTRTGTRNWRESQASNMGEIATFVFDKPHGGNFVSLADASFDTLYSALLEERRAKGRTICCQLNVTNRYLADPTATLIVDRLLAYAVKRADGPMDKATFLGGNQWSPTIERLPFDLQPIGNKRLEGFDILVVGIGTPHIDTYNENNELIGTTAAPADEKDVSLTWLRNNREAVAEFVKSGGTVLTLPVAAESDLSWPPFKVSLKNEKVFAVKQNNFFKTCRAIGPADLYWHRALELPVFASLPEGSTTTTPAILARVPYGKGEFIFTQIHPKSVY
ncbi:MAG: hypothetical protein QF473_39025, partial [Planctomycetota bacterium]|nr:hypothetical protein [Planctomycetota bacterium]